MDMTYEEIGKKMFLSTRVVEVCRDSLFAEIGVKSRGSLVAYGFRNGLIS